ncbi:hypothetical protein [Micromonospora yangpuensis]|uniref:hypothetical protein n=1 Tax=Micromonospora yangpuensis TaxID=683228 RepID=UPI001112DF2B|nr:hypothetical protein [Micromonospora yangpuensis]
MTTWLVGPDGGIDRAAGFPPGPVSTRPAGDGSLDYYLVRPAGDGRSARRDGGVGAPDGILVEEFVLDREHCAVRLDSAGWTAGERRWWRAAAFSRAVRSDPAVRARVVPVDRDEAAAVLRLFGGADLPDERTLRGYFRDGTPLRTAAPLRLGGEVTAGFHDTRVHRILFANDLTPPGLADLRARWPLTVTGDLADPLARVIGTAELRVGDDAFRWELRRIGTVSAWCVDLTSDLAGPHDDALRPMLRQLTTAMRRQGLIPVTIERFA